MDRFFIKFRFFRIFFTNAHLFLLRLTRGKLPGSDNLLLLTTTGRKSGKRRTVPLIYVRDGDNYAIVASRAGTDAPPVWSLNLQADPQASIEVGGEAIAVSAAEAGQADHERLWKELTAVYPPYDTYVTRTSRRIPVILLSPR